MYLAQIELTNRCNYACKGCLRGKATRPLGNIEMKTFMRALGVCMKMQLREVWLHNWGEPMMYPDIYPLIKRAAKHFTVGFATNGRLLTLSNPYTLYQAGLRKLDISINSTTPKEEISRLIYIYRLANFIGLECQFRTVVFSKVEYDYLSGVLKDYQVRWQRGMLHLPDKIRTHDCPAIDRVFVVYWDGTVVPCCQVSNGELVYGHVNDKDITKKIKKGVEEIHNNMFTGVCRHCFEVEFEGPVRYKLR